MIQLRNLTLDLNVNKIFENISCVIQDGDRVGVIGRNGAGKSTLLKVIAGLIKPTSGDVVIEKQARIAYLPQEDILSSKLVVFEEAFSAFSSLFETEKKIGEIEAAISDGSVTDLQLEEYAELCSSVGDFSRHDAVKQTTEVLTGLGFTETSMKKTVDELSTGWKMRLALAKLLLTDADMYLFDEPTNHLDIVTQQWFLEKLQAMKQGFLLVSHDQVYLEKACNCILEIENKKGSYYRGNLKSYLAQKQASLEIARATRARQEREIEHKQAIADRFRASASRAQMAKNLMKQIERIELVEVDSPMPTVNFHFPAPARPGTVILTFKNLSFGFGGTKLFQNVSGEIQRGDRVALVAANGVGKTTLINCIAGKYKPDTGNINFGHSVQACFFEQEQALVLNPEKTVVEEVTDACPKSTESEIRKILGSFQFSGDDVYKKIKVLSGGEKNRVAMTKVLLQRANFLILDEPTNHLDLYSKDVLCQALLAYEGTILFVSHDINFVSRLATKVLELTPSGAYLFPGTYDEFVQFKHDAQAKLVDSENKSLNNANSLKSSKAPKEQSQEHILRKKIYELEGEILKLEKEEKKITGKIADLSYGTKQYDISLQKLVEIQKGLAAIQKDWEAAHLELEKLGI